MQYASGISNSGTSLALTLPAATKAGNTLECWVAYKAAGTISSIVGTNDSLALLDGNASTNVHLSIWQKITLTGGDTVQTITFGATTPAAAYLFEIANLTAVDGGNSAGGTGPNPNTASITTTQAVDFLIACCVWQASTTPFTSQTAGFTALPDLVTTSGTSDFRLVASVNTVTAIGTYSDTWPVVPDSTDFRGEIISYKISSIIPDAARMLPPPQRLRNPQNIH